MICCYVDIKIKRIKYDKGQVSNELHSMDSVISSNYGFMIVDSPRWK